MEVQRNTHLMAVGREDRVGDDRISSLAMISSQAYSLQNFRGPLIREFVRRDIEVFTLAPDFTPGLREEMRGLGAQPVDFALDRTGRNPLQDLVDTLRLSRLLRSLSPDAIFAYFAKAVIYGSIAARLAGVERRYVLIAGAGYAFTPNTAGNKTSISRSFLRCLLKWMYRISLSCVDTVFVQNRDDERLFVGQGLADRQQVVRVPGTGVDLGSYEPAAISTEPLTFLLAARLLEEKGIREYAEAARRVQEKHEDVRFVLLGTTDENPGSLSREEVEQWCEREILEWHGWVEDVRPWIAKASVYVLPSYYREGIPRSIQEAMAMARPVITADSPGCRETVRPDENGFLVPPRNVDALVGAMEQFIIDPTLVAKMGGRSRELAEEKFDVNRINEMMLTSMGIMDPDEPG